MTRIVLDDDLAARFRDAAEPAEVDAADGRELGVFAPDEFVTRTLAEAAERSEDFRQGVHYTTDQVMAWLETLSLLEKSAGGLRSPV